MSEGAIVSGAGLPRIPCVLALLVALALTGCGTDFVPGIPLATHATFKVCDTAGFPVAGATVYLVPVDRVLGTPITGAQVLSGNAEDRDEPLEDAIRFRGAGIPQAVTDANGVATLTSVPQGRYYHFVMPVGGEHLPGGSGCRVAFDGTAVLGIVPRKIVLSSSPGPLSGYIGSSLCLACHPSFSDTTQHVHRLGLSVPGQFSSLQDATRYPTILSGWSMFLPGIVPTSGTPVYLFDYDGSRGEDKFQTTLTDPITHAVPMPAQMIAWLWEDTGSSTFKITLENMLNPGDPLSPWTLTVPLTYGGALTKMIHLVRLPGREGLYPLLGYQNDGDDTRYDRERKVYRDFAAGTFWNPGTGMLTLPPPSATFDGSCAACHLTGLTRFQDGATMEWLSDAANDPGGAFDIDGDGSIDEVNVGCEMCHGPGGQHGTWAGDPLNAGQQARFIVTPQNLSPSRELLICGRCHDRPQGAGPVNNEEPLDPAGLMARPGTSRTDWLAGFTTRKGPDTTDYWGDDLHSFSRHQQYSDLLKSGKHRNQRVLVTCAKCHGSHGADGPWRQQLRSDPDDWQSNLCQQCHFLDQGLHTAATTTFPHTIPAAACAKCHMAQTAKSGSGVYGSLLAPPDGGPLDELRVYYQNDLSSHLFGPHPSKSHPEVSGVTPSLAMPIPYTRSCASPCHTNSPLLQLGPKGPIGGSHLVR